MLLVAMVMRAAAVAQAEALGSVHGVGRRLGICGNGERLDDVADVGVQRYQPPGETEGNAALWFLVPGSWFPDQTLVRWAPVTEGWDTSASQLLLSDAVRYHSTFPLFS